jgi:hypothetical protein
MKLLFTIGTLGAFIGNAKFKTNRTRLLVGVQLLTLQTFLMFMLAVTYDIDVSFYSFFPFYPFFT